MTRVAVILLLLVAAFFVLVMVADESRSEKLTGYVVLIGGTVLPGIYLVRLARRRNRGRAMAGAGGSMSSDDEAHPVRDQAAIALVRAVRADRGRLIRHILIGTGIFVFAVVAATLFAPELAQSGLFIVAISGVAAAIAFSRRTSTRGHSEVVPRSDVMSTESMSFRNIAYSKRPPTWRGWTRDVADVVIGNLGVDVVGLKDQLRIVPPISAQVGQVRWFYWPMATVSGFVDSESVVLYMAVRGAPRSKFAASHSEMEADTRRLANAINNISLR